MNWGYIARIGVVAVLAGLGALKASIGDGLDGPEIVDIFEVTIAAGATYAGLGAASKTIEPEVGRKP